MSDVSRRFLPLLLLLSVLLWFYTTTGGRQVFVNEVLGAAYDSQAEHFLRGNVDVDVEAIGHEAMIVDGKVRMYFGPFPAFLRIPLNSVYPAGYGKWSRISGFCAGVIALCAFAGLVGIALRSSLLSSQARNCIGNACVVGFALGSPLLLLLGNLSIYDEAIIWGLAWSLAALFFALRSRDAESAALTRTLLGFSVCAAGALLSRVTFGIPFILIALLLALRIRRENRIANFTALILPLAAALVFYVWLSYARFGSFIGVNYDYYINPVHSDFAHKYGVFSLRRIPHGFADYFSLRFPSLDRLPPFLAADRHSYNYPSLFSNPDSEVYLSLLWSSSWLVFAAIVGIIYLVRRKGADLFETGVAVALLTQLLCILSYFTLAQRYAADLYPFLIFCFLVFLSSSRAASLPSRYIIVGLVGLSVVINSLATVSWLVDADLNVPAKTRAAWEKVIGRRSYERWK
ncbi:MAG TPA: hypothetical protein VE867_05440 [Candidatus Binatia bacterium]|nr:hypothetical protein [Candidatus Binatia bacterium]